MYPVKGREIDGPVADRLLDAKAMAAFLGITGQTVRKLAAEGRIPAFRIPAACGEGFAYRFDRSEVLAALREEQA